MNLPGSLSQQHRSTVRVCSGCYSLMRPGRSCCASCGNDIRRREAWERVVAVVVVGWLVGALMYQLVQ